MGQGLRVGERWKRGGGCGYARATRALEVMGLLCVLTAVTETRTDTSDTVCVFKCAGLNTHECVRTWVKGARDLFHFFFKYLFIHLAMAGLGFRAQDLFYL